MVTYQARLQEIQARLADAQAKQSEALLILGAVAFVFVILAVLALTRRNLPVWSPLLTLPPAAWAIEGFGKRRLALRRQRRLHAHYERGMQRLEHRWQGQGDDGEEFSPDTHPYARDLGLFGKGSLFELLCTVRTQIGQGRLASYLLEPPTLDESRRRQEAVQELKGLSDLREEIALLGGYDRQESNWDTFTDWLENPPKTLGVEVRLGTALLAVSVVTLGIVGFFGLWSVTSLIATLTLILIAEGALALFLRDRVRRVIGDTQMVGVELGVLRQGTALLSRQRFSSPKLREIVAQVGSDGAPRLRRLERFVRILEIRNQDWFYVPCLLLMVGTQTAMAIESWRARNSRDFLAWLDAWGEFEALNALACYAFERQEATSFPELTDSQPVFNAEALGHPLLKSEERVCNDFELSSPRKFYVVSGSNMSGKSTFLRSVGVNAVLAMAGAPVTAKKLVMSPFKVCTSISIVDSLLEGKSKFRAEIERLRDAIASTKNSRCVLFLIDEVLSGTNSRDRRIATESVVKTLVAGGALGALSTHDLSLTEIADSIDGGTNVHMASRPGGDVLDFDYLLKPGVTPETNAVAIARLAGVPL